MTRATIPLNSQSTTEPDHVFAHPAPVTLMSSTMMSNGAKRGERGRRMVPVKPKPLSRLHPISIEPAPPQAFLRLSLR